MATSKQTGIGRKDRKVLNDLISKKKEEYLKTQQGNQVVPNRADKRRIAKKKRKDG